MIENKSVQAFLVSLGARSRALRHPKSAVFELTYGCNFRCVHCLNPTHAVRPGELARDEIFRILDQMSEMGILELVLTGGEPFTRSDFFEILERAHGLGFVMTVLTNATHLTLEKIKKMEGLRLQISPSIYGATQETYERVTGRPGSYEKFLRGMDLLTASRIPVSMHLPLMTLNRHELAEAKEFARVRGFHFQYCLEIHPRQDGSLDPFQFRLSPVEKVSVIEEMGEEIKAGCRVLKDKKTSDSGDAGQLSSSAFIDCECGQSSFAINPYGEMNLCTVFPMPRYDLRRGTVREGWEALKRTVDEACPNEKYQCPNCEFISYCRQGRSDAWLETGDMSVCLEHFKSVAAIERDYHENRLLR